MTKSFNGPTSLFPDIFVFLCLRTFHFIKLCFILETFSFPELRTQKGEL